MFFRNSSSIACLEGPITTRNAAVRFLCLAWIAGERRKQTTLEKNEAASSSCWESALHWLQHRPAAAEGSAITSKIALELSRSAALRFQAVVEEQFVTRFKIAASSNIDSAF